MKPAEHTGQLARLRRIEGQVKGVIRMVEEQRYCVDILTQLRAIRSAIKGVEDQVLREHVEHCIVQAVRGGSRAERDAKIEELLTVLGRYGG
jgi:CsoR family transcriptional regulator, copper-sensing transcriptional repressor